MFWNPPLWYAILCFAIAFAALVFTFVFVREVTKDRRRATEPVVVRVTSEDGWFDRPENRF